MSLKKCLIGLFIITSLFIFGCTETNTYTKPAETEVSPTPATTSAKTPTSAVKVVEYKKYTNKMFDFKIEYPTDWDYKEGLTYSGDDTNSQTTSIVVFYKKSTLSDEYEAVGVLYTKMNPETASLVGVNNVEDLTRFVVSSLSGAKVKSISSEVLGGKKYGVAEFALAIGGQVILKKFSFVGTPILEIYG